MEAQIPEILPQGHPSFGTAKAIFLFALGQAPTRLLSVEATNSWAVLCLERLLLTDGKVSNNCQVLQVVRDYRNIGTRNDLVQEPTFVEFMLDIVEPARLLRDAIAQEAFKNALTDEERQYALRHVQEISGKTEEIPLAIEDMLPDEIPVEDALPAPEPVMDGQPEKLISAMTGLGFKRPEVHRWVTSLGDQARTGSMHSLIREGLRVLA
jgi:hypothetical protein